MTKFLEDIKEYEAQQVRREKFNIYMYYFFFLYYYYFLQINNLQLQNKKEKLKQFFKEAIEDKKQFDLELKNEDEFEERAIEIYRNAQMRIQKLHKSLKLKEKEEKKQHAQEICN